jgi:hypothetical protein
MSDLNPNLGKHIRENYIKLLGDLCREIDLSFDQIEKNVIKNLEKNISEINDENFNSIVKQHLCMLESCKEQFNGKINLKKPRTKDFDFFDNLIFLGIDFKLFKHENKNTKKTLFKYLQSLYTHQIIVNVDENSEQYKKMIENIFNKQELGEFLPPFPLPTNLMNSDIMNPIQSLMDNKEIMNMASEITRDIQNSNINPMNLMTSLLNGRTDDTINGLMNTITLKINKKIKDGEIDCT